jgi:O-antigen/teichoic acid export membrane protein
MADRHGRAHYASIVANVGVIPRARSGGTVGRVLENVGWLASAKALGAVLSLVYLGLATRTLGPEGFGQFVLILGTAQAAAAVVAFQTWQLIVHFGMPHLAAGRRDAVDRLILFSIALDLGGGLIGCVLATAGVLLLGPHLGWSDDVQVEAILFAFVILLAVRSTATGILRLFDRYALAAAADAAMPVARLIGALIVLAAGATVTRFLIAWAVAEVVTAIAYWTMVVRATGYRYRWPSRSTVRGVRAENPGIVTFALISNAGSTLSAVGRSAALLLVGVAAGAGAAGGYRLAHQLALALAKIADLLSRGMFSELARAHASEDRSQLGQLFRRSSAVALIAGLLIAALVVFAGHPILGLVAGKEYLYAYPLLVILGLAAAVDVVGVSFEPTLLATGRAALAFRLRLTATVFLLGLMLFLLDRMGVTGAAWASLAASTLALVLFGVAGWRAAHPPRR